MKSKRSGITLVEILLAISLIGILLALIWPVPPRQPSKVQTLSDLKQLHLATQQMALDGLTTGDTNLGWPGDIGGTFTNWIRQLLADGTNGYLSTNDLCRLLSAGKKIVKPSDLSAMSNTSILVYAVRDDSSGAAIFLTSANFTNTPEGGLPLNRSTWPYGTNGFVIFRKGGEGAILRQTDVGATNLRQGFVPLCR